MTFTFIGNASRLSDIYCHPLNYQFNCSSNTVWTFLTSIFNNDKVHFFFTLISGHLHANSKIITGYVNKVTEGFRSLQMKEGWIEKQCSDVSIVTLCISYGVISTKVVFLLQMSNIFSNQSCWVSVWWL